METTLGGDAPMPPTGELIVFAMLAGLTLFMGAFAMTRKNPVTAVMSLVASFVGLAGIYATLSAHFVAVLQVLVYAGAIMVLFIFVVMILNREEISRVSFRGIFTRTLGVLAGIYLLSVFVSILVRTGAVSFAAPTVVLPDSFGTVASVGRQLFTGFVFPFEAISVLLLVAIVGGVVVSRSHRQEEEATEVARRQAAVRNMISVEQRLGVGPVGAGEPHSTPGHGHH